MMSWIRWRGRLPDRPGKPKRVVRVNWERLADTPVGEVFNSPLWRNFLCIPGDVGDVESKWTMFNPLGFHVPYRPGMHRVVAGRSSVPVMATT